MVINGPSGRTVTGMGGEAGNKRKIKKLKGRRRRREINKNSGWSEEEEQWMGTGDQNDERESACNNKNRFRYGKLLPNPRMCGTSF
jgi:hypothetical protein